MPSPGFQVGAVRGHGVVYARGLEIDLANALAARLGVPRVVFYQEPRFDRLLGPGPKPWDIALAEVTITPERAANVLFSIPYLEAEQGVLARRGLKSTPTTIAQLAQLRLCTRTNTTAAALIASQVRPGSTSRRSSATPRACSTRSARAAATSSSTTPRSSPPSARRCRGCTGRSSA